MFGIWSDPDKLDYTAVEDGGLGSPFPHIYVSLCSNPINKERLVNSIYDGSCISQMSDLEISLQFDSENSQTSSVYVFYAIYTDMDSILDVKNNFFVSLFEIHVRAPSMVFFYFCLAAILVGNRHVFGQDGPLLAMQPFVFGTGTRVLEN